MATILSRGVQVRARIEQLGGAFSRIIYVAIVNPTMLKDFLRGTETHRCRTGPARSQARRAASIALDGDHRCNPNYREIAVAPAELLEGPSGVGRLRRHPHFDQHLARLQSGGHEAHEKLSRAHHALAGGATDHKLSVERRYDRGIFRGRIGVRETAANRAARAGRQMTDPSRRFRQQRQAAFTNGENSIAR